MSKTMEMNLPDPEHEEFMALAGPIIETPAYQRLRQYIQHGKVTTYQHCLDVAWQAFRMNRRLHMGVNEADLVAACLLHDYYLYDWHDHGDRLHGFHHPDIAARCARDDFHVSEEVQEAIRSHMWPLTLSKVPAGKIGWLLTMSDKICSAKETMMLRR